MRARLLWALLLLAAVFSMHGLSCAAADSGMTGMSTTSSTGAAADPPGPAGTVLDEHGTTTDTSVGHSTGQPDGHSSPAHALMLCLAVLAGGAGAILAVLAGWLARRRLLTTCTPTALRVRVTLDRTLACAPAPELSRLCVLRV